MENQGRSRPEEEAESPPSINLVLGIGGPSCSITSSSNYRLNDKRSGRIVKVEGDDHQVVEREKCRRCSIVRFTEEQLNQFKIQLLIFKCMVSGLPVPLQLLFPIWRSFSSASGSPYGDLYRRTPFLPGLSHRGFGNQYKMDSEPGRCRRTDGKKWRCHHSVIPNEKYCERHMHRGSKRSRKLVEASNSAAAPNPGTLNCENNSNGSLGLKLSADLDEKSQPRNDMKKNSMSTCSNAGGITRGTNGPTRIVIRTPTLTSNTAKNKVKDKQNSTGKHYSLKKERIAFTNLSSGLDFSPKSVLQGQGCSIVAKGDNDPKSELGRGIGTDGKKWQWSKEVMPDHKYSAHQLQKSSKKPAVAFTAYGEGKAATGYAPRAKLSRPERQEIGLELGLNTDLNVSVPASQACPSPNTEDGLAENGGSGSTTETTITDDSSTDTSDTMALSV